MNNETVNQLKNLACDVALLSGRKVINGYIENEYIEVEVGVEGIQVLDNGDILIKTSKK